MIQFEPLMSPSPVSIMGTFTDWFDNGPIISWARTNPWGDSFSEGSSCKGDMMALTAAAGEMLERAAFTKWPAKIENDLYKLKDLPSSHLGESFIKAFEQTSHSPLPSCIEYDLRDDGELEPVDHHSFSTQRAVNLFSGEICPVPDVVVSLNEAHPDRLYYPVSDSVGCSYHTTPQEALYTAVMEFLERQALLAHWLTGFSNAEYDLNTQLDLSKGALLLLERFGSLGTLRAFEISPFANVSIPLLLLQAPDEHPVSFCIASSADVCPQKAFADSLFEFCQSYRFLFGRKENENKLMNLDIYQKTFLDANRCETCARFPAWRNKLPRISLQPRRQKPMERQMVFDSLKKISSQCWCIFRSAQRGDNISCICKILSPDFFLNMSIPHLNLNNPFLKSLNLPVIKENASTELPLP